MRVLCPVSGRIRRLRRIALVAAAATMIALPFTGYSQSSRTASHIKRPLIYQIGNVVRIYAEGDRPLLRALGALQEKYGWIVDYEDPRYPANSEVATNPASLQRRHPNAANFRREAFTVEFTSGPAPDSRPDENAVLTAVVNAYNESNGAAQFELRKSNVKNKDQGGHFAVVGVGVTDENNESVSQQPILDLPLTLPIERRSTEQTISLICQLVSEHSKIPVTTSGIADSVHGHGEVTIGGINVPAQTLLSSTLASAGDRSTLSWRLLYEKNTKSYEFSLSGAPPPQ
jgi:hypothetical protein